MTSNSFKLRTGILLVSIFLPSLSVLAQTPAVRARVTERVDVQKLATLRGNVHPLARPEFDQGVAPDDLPMQRMLLVLQRAPEQETSLRQLLDDQQVKSSSRFHQWLTPEQFGQQFGPADSDVQAVTDWLASQGFQVTKVAAGRTVIEFPVRQDWFGKSWARRFTGFELTAKITGPTPATRKFPPRSHRWWQALPHSITSPGN